MLHATTVGGHNAEPVQLVGLLLLVAIICRPAGALTTIAI